ncbi:MAG TPA: hypothetical protein VGO49_04125 [Bradyrhizobium sp.]|nr:hypothetical protein [Bradyrhizobium sp.]
MKPDRLDLSAVRPRPDGIPLQAPKRFGAGIAALLMSVAAAWAQPAPSPAPPQQSDPATDMQELRRDIGEQREREQSAQLVEQIQKRLLQSRRDVQQIRIIRAKLRDFLDAKECIGAEPYLKRLDQQQGDANVLLSDLSQQCSGVSGETSRSLAEACRTERSKLGEEVSEIMQSRARFAQQCQRPGS